MSNTTRYGAAPEPQDRSPIETILIFDSKGSLISSVLFANKTKVIDVSGYENGVYTYLIVDEDKKMNSGKIVISH